MNYCVLRNFFSLTVRWFSAKCLQIQSHTQKRILTWSLARARERVNQIYIQLLNKGLVFQIGNFERSRNVTKVEVSNSINCTIDTKYFV